MVVFFSFFISSNYLGTNIIKKYRRTETGIEISKKISGLKRYFNDFSIIYNRSYSEKILWEDYLFYAILFNKKGILNKEMNKKFKDMKTFSSSYLFHDYLKKEKCKSK